MPVALLSPVCSLELLPSAQALNMPTAALLFSALSGYLFNQHNYLWFGQHNEVNTLPVSGLGLFSSCPLGHAPGITSISETFQMFARSHPKASHRSRSHTHTPDHFPDRSSCFLPLWLHSLLFLGQALAFQRATTL